MGFLNLQMSLAPCRWEVTRRQYFTVLSILDVSNQITVSEVWRSSAINETVLKYMPPLILPISASHAPQKQKQSCLRVIDHKNRTIRHLLQKQSLKFQFPGKDSVTSNIMAFKVKNEFLKNVINKTVKPAKVFSNWNTLDCYCFEALSRSNSFV